MDKIIKLLFKRIIIKAKIEENKWYLKNLNSSSYSWLEISDVVIYSRIKELENKIK